MSRKQFILSLGATCKNWQNSWSFVDHKNKRVIFGEWQNRQHGMIFSADWESKRLSGRKNPGFKESREHIRLAEEEGYELYVFPMYARDPESEKAEIHHIEEHLSKRDLQCRDGRNWYAVGDAESFRPTQHTWILQGNPKIYDIDDYLSRYPLIYWRTPTHKNSIYFGDRVYMWRAGVESGIVASGVVVELPTTDDRLKYPDALGDDLWMADGVAKRGLDPKAQKVGISIDSVRLTQEEGMIPRSTFLADKILSVSKVIKQPNSTVFQVSADEAGRIKELWDGTGAASSDPIDASAVEGDVKIASHRKRERSRSLIAKKLKIARSQGPIRCEVCLISEEGVYPLAMAPRIFEVHHLRPLAEAVAPVKTTLQDLAVVCANCHRAIHSSKDVEENFRMLKEALASS